MIFGKFIPDFINKLADFCDKQIGNLVTLFAVKKNIINQ